MIKSQPIWIKFCIHLLLYGMHLWADLDRDRHMGGSRPNQNDCFCNTCITHPISPVRRIAAISAENRQSGGEDGCYREKFRNFVAWAEPDPKQHFLAFSGYPRLQETVLPQTNGTDEKPRLCRCALC